VSDARRRASFELEKRKDGRDERGCGRCRLVEGKPMIIEGQPSASGKTSQNELIELNSPGKIRKNPSPPAHPIV